MPKPKSADHRRKQKQQKPNRLPLFLVLGGAILLLVTLFFVFRKSPAPFTPEVTGTPSARVDKNKVDLGDEKLGNTAQVTFRVTNVGDQTLHITETPYIEVKEGCWPPTPAIGSMALKPGESTNISMEFLMHGDMGGKHNFLVHVPTNDPKNKDLQLTVLSNWVP